MNTAKIITAELVTPDAVECSLCDATMPTVDAAIDADWEPSYFDDGVETGYPICPACVANKCTMTPEGPELRKPRTVQSELKLLDDRRVNLLRDLFYKVADALPQLAEELEFADMDTGMEGGPLLGQHLAACEMLEAFKRIELGKYL